MKKNIAIVAGGDSSEYIISLKSAEGVYSFIDRSQYNTYIVSMVGSLWQVEFSDTEKILIDKNDFSFTHEGVKTTFDFAYIMIHGTPGENGLLQGYFELIGLPYSSSNVLSSAMTFNKFCCNNYLKGFGVKVSESLLLRKGQAIDNETVERVIGYPCFVKPNEGGSSFGISKVKTDADLQPAILKSFAEANEVLIESFMNGMELTCGLYKTKNNTVVFPLY